jgi:glycosyltransferase involved in cell wall biosynthesis
MGSVRVRRFPIRPRDIDLFHELDGEMRRGVNLSDDTELIWLRNGASSEEMEDELDRVADDYDAVLALPYLFGTTYFAFETCPDKCVLIPCLHDEPAAHTHFAERMLTETRAILFNSDAEAKLARRIAPNLAPWTTVGVGVEPRPATRTGPKKGSPPSVLYVGRREPDKNYPTMLAFFTRYKQRRPGDLRLVFAGSGDPLPQRSDIVEVEPDWDTSDFYRDATIFCHPGLNESLSIVLLQAWLSERPAVVHADCEVTREHCERSNGGLWFRSYPEFEEILDRLLASPELCAQLGRNGRAYVEREYTWDVVLRRFDDAIESFLTKDHFVAPVAHETQ